VMDESRLFDEGCRLCDQEKAQCLSRQIGPYKGALYCMSCFNTFGKGPDAFGIDDEITRRLSLRSAPAPEFKVGDTLVGVGLGGNERSGIIAESTQGSEGKFARLTNGGYLRLESLRRAETSPETAPGEGEFYVTQPDPLPETLPAGTRWAVPGDETDMGVFHSEAKLVHGDYLCGQMLHDSGRL